MDDTYEGLVNAARKLTQYANALARDERCSVTIEFGRMSHTIGESVDRICLNKIYCTKAHKENREDPIGPYTVSINFLE